MNSDFAIETLNVTKKYLNQVFSELDNFSNKKSLSLQESTMRDIKKIKTNKDLFKKYKKKII